MCLSRLVHVSVTVCPVCPCVSPVCPYVCLLAVHMSIFCLVHLSISWLFICLSPVCPYVSLLSVSYLSLCLSVHVSVSYLSTVSALQGIRGLEGNIGSPGINGLRVRTQNTELSFLPACPYLAIFLSLPAHPASSLLLNPQT